MNRDSQNDSWRPPKADIDALVTRLTEDEVMSFLNKRTRSFICSACGNTNWNLFFPPDVRFGFTGMRLPPEKPHLPAPLFPCVHIVCTYCCNIRAHSLEAMAEVMLKEQHLEGESE